jgi:hypothetical protein
MFKYLVYHKDINFATSINDRTLFIMVKFQRLDIIKFIHISELIKLDQFQWDVMLLHSCFSYCKRLDQNSKLLVEYCLFNGSKLYKTVLHCSTSKDTNLIEYILKQEDIYTNDQPQDYMIKVYFCNRYHNTHSPLLADRAMIKMAELSVNQLTGTIDNEYLFFFACRCGNKDLLDELIRCGYDHYKSGASVALLSGQYSISNYLLNKWTEKYAQLVQRVANI